MCRAWTGAEALAALGELDEEVSNLTTDLNNAAVPAGEPARTKEAKLAELESLAQALAEARRVQAESELRAQLGR